MCHILRTILYICVNNNMHLYIYIYILYICIPKYIRKNTCINENIYTEYSENEQRSIRASSKQLVSGDEKALSLFIFEVYNYKYK